MNECCLNESDKNYELIKKQTSQYFTSNPHDSSPSIMKMLSPIKHCLQAKTVLKNYRGEQGMDFFTEKALLIIGWYLAKNNRLKGS